MHLLTARGLVLVGLAVLLVVQTAVVGGHPPEQQRHGIDEERFPMLWSGDREDGSVRSGLTMARLASVTDIPFSSPPAEVEQWNRAESQLVPATGPGEVIVPPGATVRHGRFLRDISVAVFAVQPSTIAHLSSDRTSWYVGSNGSVLGVVDYRVSVPPSTSHGNESTSWSLVDHIIKRVSLHANGKQVDQVGGERTPVLRFTGLDDAPEQVQTLELSAEVSATVRKRTVTVERQCVHIDGNRVCHGIERVETSTVDESVTVRRSVHVRTYELSSSARLVRFPNGDLGVAAGHTQPWVGFSIAERRIRTGWLFYSTRVPAWDTLIVRDSAGSREIRSPVHPLQVHAFPSTLAGRPRGGSSGVQSEGSLRPTPALPAEVHLPVAVGEYLNVEHLAVRLDGSSGDQDAVRVHGLVRGTDRTISTEDVLSIRSSEVQVAVANRTTDGILLRIRLTGNDGRRINTAGTSGYVTVGSKRVETTTNGTATVQIATGRGAVVVRYVPEPWWESTRPYTGSETVVMAVPHLDLRWASQVVVIPAVLFGLLILLMDGLFRWSLWPPWRQL